ncbi:cysteine desulfurase family protein [Phascolarctobacterium succinatutens]|jgi:cysteine desulfurase|uniref:cysteine desulfurase n=1 Tax=Phascolarctobacterium succinatutens YIT 12067 TaxID=626939 RepID=E8LF15_9FIRM|nr:cysteine desulfurase family protein [Phascolarctobacterium succinatutens]EFY04578.1 cysteine desulfurase [Phascolarctobacterium succinatutens YIT 12067]MDD7140643.1 cysteine desulfurase family protein [Phascolarctobacterium succinatutens]
MEKQFIYADNAATTKMSDVAVRAMLPYLQEIYANASSVHLLGQRSAAALFSARQQVAQVLNCAPKEVFFTSGGSEADNQALISAAALGKKQGKCHIVSTAMEHHAILHTLEALEAQGFTVTLLRPQADGIVTATQVAEAITDTTCLISVMYANNETGAIQPIREIGALCRKRGVLFHTDAVQAAGHLTINVQRDNIDMLSLSAHKFHGPKGIGLLFAKSNIQLTSLIRGGGQERGKRAGTENLPSIIGLATALKDAQEHMQQNTAYITGLRDALRNGLDKIDGAGFNGSREHCLPGTVNYSFQGVNGETLLSLLSNEGICCSSGSACSAGSLEPSHVLLALGLSHETAKSALRFSLCEYNTMDEVQTIITKVTEAVNRLRR